MTNLSPYCRTLEWNIVGEEGGGGSPQQVSPFNILLCLQIFIQFGLPSKFIVQHQNILQGMIDFQNLDPSSHLWNIHRK